MSCGDPGPLVNSIAIGSSYLYGDHVNYTCIEGYEPASGNTSIYCDLSQQVYYDVEWVGNPLNCQGEYSVCHKKCLLIIYIATIQI